MFMDDEGAIISPLTLSKSNESNNSNSNPSSSPTITMILNKKSSCSDTSSRGKTSVSFEDVHGTNNNNRYTYNNNKNIHHSISPTSSGSTNHHGNNWNTHNDNDNDDDHNDNSPTFNPFLIHSGPEHVQHRHSPHHQHHYLQGTSPTSPSSPLDANKVLKKVLLPSTGYGKFGTIQYRADIPSMIFKKWHDGYWLHVYPATICVFGSLEDLHRWKEMTMSTTVIENDSELNLNACSFVQLDTNEMKKQRDKLVKTKINFDTTGDLVKKMKKLEEKNRKLLKENANIANANNNQESVGSGSHTLKKKKKKVSDVNQNILPINYIMEQVRSKYYRKDDPLMHTFKISYLGLTGRNVSAAFGSSKPQEVKRLRAVIRDVIHLSKKASKKQSKKDKNDIYNDNASSMFKVSNAKSEVTALSNTVYGRNTMTNQAAKRFNSNNQRF